jgi:hypothetical protein
VRDTITGARDETRRCRRGRGRIVLATLVLLGATVPALAQGWSWPWSTPSQPPVPREPVYRPQPPSQPQPGYQPAPGAPYGSQGGSQRSAICLQLEQRLAQEANRGSQSRDQLPRLEGEIRQTARQVQTTENQLERADCFEYFLFSKTLRRTGQCIALSRQLEDGKRRLYELESQRQTLAGSSGRSYQDDIIQELARNNCGAAYQQEASRRGGGSSIWQDEGEGGAGGGGRFGSLPFATYRTICVRLCDGYYFPVSFSTLPAHFDRDQDVCQSRCAAPAELFYHQNPGGAVESAVSHKSKVSYASLRTAFRYRKEYIQGCSCKQAEYVPQPGGTERRADGAVAAPGPALSSAQAQRAPQPRQ